MTLPVVILAGGLATRLNPITEQIPKSLVEVAGQPFISHQLKYLEKQGIKQVTLCIGYLGEMVQSVVGDGRRFGVDITYSLDGVKLLGTGGAIKKAGKMIKDKSFFVINGDTITNIDLKKLATKKNAIAAIELRTKYGILETDDDKITNFKEKKEISDTWMNAGIYHLQKEVLKELPNKGDIEKTVFPDYAKKGILDTIKFKNAKWYSVDLFKDMEECALEVEKIIK